MLLRDKKKTSRLMGNACGYGFLFGMLFFNQTMVIVAQPREVKTAELYTLRNDFFNNITLKLHNFINIFLLLCYYLFYVSVWLYIKIYVINFSLYSNSLSHRKNEAKSNLCISSQVLPSFLFTQVAIFSNFYSV